MRLNAAQAQMSTLSSLQSSSVALRQSMSASVLAMHERAKDLEWFQTSLSIGTLPQVASTPKLLPSREGRVQWAS